MLEAMVKLAESRSQERVMKEALYSSGKLNMRLASTDELHMKLVGDTAPAYLRRKREQGKGDV
jgi:hypothetical protein